MPSMKKYLPWKKVHNQWALLFLHTHVPHIELWWYKPCSSLHSLALSFSTILIPSSAMEKQRGNHRKMSWPNQVQDQPSPVDDVLMSPVQFLETLNLLSSKRHLMTSQWDSISWRFVPPKNKADVSGSLLSPFGGFSCWALSGHDFQNWEWKKFHPRASGGYNFLKNVVFFQFCSVM